MAEQFSGNRCRVCRSALMMGEQGEHCPTCEKAAKLELGAVVVTPAAMTLAVKVAGYGAAALTLLNGLLDRYRQGDWGVLDAEDVAQNDAACSADDPQRVLANYPITGGDGSVRDEGRIWIITEWDRSVTTILLPDDY